MMVVIPASVAKVERVTMLYVPLMVPDVITVSLSEESANTFTLLVLKADADVIVAITLVGMMLGLCVGALFIEPNPLVVRGD